MGRIEKPGGEEGDNGFVQPPSDVEGRPFLQVFLEGVGGDDAVLDFLG